MYLYIIQNILDLTASNQSHNKLKLTKLKQKIPKILDTKMHQKQSITACLNSPKQHSLGNEFLKMQSSSFQQQLYANTRFIESLRKQSGKIQEMLRYIDRLKAEGAMKDRLIMELKKKQTQLRLEIVQSQELLVQQHSHNQSLSLQRIQQLQSENKILQAQLQTAKTNQLSPQLQYIKNLSLGYTNKEVESFKAQIQSMRAGCEKMKSRYQSCREELGFVRLELEDQRKATHQLQHMIKQINIKHSQQLNQLSHSHSQKQKSFQSEILAQKSKIAALDSEKKVLQHQLCQLQQHLSSQIGNYEQKIRAINLQVANLQRNGYLWKQRYYQLQQIVNHVEGVRGMLRNEKIWGITMSHQDNDDTLDHAYNDYDQLASKVQTLTKLKFHNAPQKYCKQLCQKDENKQNSIIEQRSVQQTDQLRKKQLRDSPNSVIYQSKRKKIRQSQQLLISQQQ